MKYQALFSSKDKSKKLKGDLLQFLFGALRVHCPHSHFHFRKSTTLFSKQGFSAL